MEKQSFVICWLKESTGAVCYLHSDKRFYRDFISMRGCNLVTYKTRAAADKKAQTYKGNKDGLIISLNSEDVEQLESDWRKDRRAVLFRYTDNKDLPAFEDAQPQENGVILCRVQSAASISTPGRCFDALLSERPNIYNWESAVLLIVRREHYNNKGVFQGVPVFVIRPAELPNVRPHKLFNLLNGGNVTDIINGVTDWDSRADWLACFTDEEKRAAVAIEKHLQTLTAATA